MYKRSLTLLPSDQPPSQLPRNRGTPIASAALDPPARIECPRYANPCGAQLGHERGIGGDGTQQLLVVGQRVQVAAAVVMVMQTHLRQNRHGVIEK